MMKQFFEMVKEAFTEMKSEDKVTLAGLAAVVALVLGTRNKRNSIESDDDEGAVD